jgi:hypothetical protein
MAMPWKRAYGKEAFCKALKKHRLNHDGPADAC